MLDFIRRLFQRTPEATIPPATTEEMATAVASARHRRRQWQTTSLDAARRDMTTGAPAPHGLYWHAMSGNEHTEQACQGGSVSVSGSHYSSSTCESSGTSYDSGGYPDSSSGSSSSSGD